MLQRLAHQNKAIIDGHEKEGHSDPNIGFAPVHTDTKRNAEQRETKTSKRESDLAVDLKNDRRHQVLALFLPLRFSLFYLLRG